MVDVYFRNPLYFTYIIGLNSAVTMIGILKIVNVYRKSSNLDRTKKMTPLEIILDGINNNKLISISMICVHLILIFAYINVTQPYYSLLIEEAVPAHWYYF